jgi:short subunit dehydrogenase-like uncharacterized protein
MSQRRRVLIVGGYGTFGGRLAMLLADEPRLCLIIAGRSHDKASAFCAALPPGAERIAAAFDRDGELHRQLGALLPDMVVDATGPFQAYGDDPYRLVRACVELGIDYLDLADGSVSSWESGNSTPRRGHAASLCCPASAAFRC